MRYTILTEYLYLRFLEAYRQFYFEVYKKLPSEEYWKNFIMFVSQNMHNDNYLFLLAVEGKKVRGFCIVAPVINFEEIPTAIVEPLYVFPKWRNQGIGKNLIAIIKGWLKKKGYKKVITTEEFNKNTFKRKQKLLGLKPVRVILEKELE
ncbi:MAG TPA: GNAT family N-acetyltransferase [bacterium]|nr:GNAT family N-acetyltransferase [bacterium]